MEFVVTFVLEVPREGGFVVTFLLEVPCVGEFQFGDTCGRLIRDVHDGSSYLRHRACVFTPIGSIARR